ncbi:collagen alpha-2(I) chain-like [Hippopotamus amphibius kiboko]|uniref:collagen alpha-2(I) chain-like n=1 Tax=Hippopotamus amphibius kiboko TaxID=575201 RepID=UPI002593D04F|nr:collagen alpha-2(I) chain-like [Hippopotamus amphibius kiboko]
MGVAGRALPPPADGTRDPGPGLLPAPPLTWAPSGSPSPPARREPSGTVRAWPPEPERGPQGRRGRRAGPGGRRRGAGRRRTDAPPGLAGPRAEGPRRRDGRARGGPADAGGRAGGRARLGPGGGALLPAARRTRIARWVQWFLTVQQFCSAIVKCLGPLDPAGLAAAAATERPTRGPGAGARGDRPRGARGARGPRAAQPGPAGAPRAAPGRFRGRARGRAQRQAAGRGGAGRWEALGRAGKGPVRARRAHAPGALPARRRHRRPPVPWGPPSLSKLRRLPGRALAVAALPGAGDAAAAPSELEWVMGSLEGEPEPSLRRGPVGGWGGMGRAQGPRESVWNE